MFKVIIVDDEIWSVIGMRRILQSRSHQFQLIYETTDPVDAFEKILSMQPDVVVTDIRMPELSGIELMQKVRSHGLRTEFIVISGFAEFSYVQEAMKAGAMDYQLKPFDASSIQLTFDKLYAKLSERRNSQDMRVYAALRDCPDRVVQNLQACFGKPLYPFLQVALIQTQSPEPISFSTLSLENAQVRILKIGPRKSVLIFNTQKDQTPQLLHLLEEQQQHFIKAAVSLASADPTSFGQLVKYADRTLLDSFIYPNKKIFQRKLMNKNAVDRLCRSLQALYSKQSHQQIYKLMQELPNIFIQENLGIEDACYFWNRLSLSLGAESSGDGPCEQLDAYELLERYADITEMSLDLYNRFFHSNNSFSMSANDSFFQLVSYIDDNYAETILLKDLCGKFHINMSYCCELFQKYKQMTFSKYLTNVRINRSCELLRYPSLNVSEICEAVGYNDYFYFNKVFKRIKGCTPAEYRKAMCGEGS